MRVLRAVCVFAVLFLGLGAKAALDEPALGIAIPPAKHLPAALRDVPVSSHDLWEQKCRGGKMTPAKCNACFCVPSNPGGCCFVCAQPLPCCKTMTC